MRKFKNLYHLFKAIFWNIWYGFPAKRLFIIGVTGTDGKTTTSTLIYEILKKSGYKVGVLTTVSAKLMDTEIDTGLHTTNPDSGLLQKVLKQAVDLGITHMVLEVTSHGLDQNRVWGCDFKIGVITNVSHEHLDYHKTMQNYMKAKAKLFSETEYAVLNKEDSSFDYIKSNCNSKCKVISYSKTKIKNISPTLFGDYNLYNVGAAESVAKILGIDEGVINEVVSNFSGVPGRRQEVKVGQNFRVIVDFAHTPNALKQLLLSLRAESKSRIILVFGCTGERDKEKRPIMGKIASELADIVIVTSDDTRSESQNNIASQIVNGIRNSEYRIKNKKLFLENDRRKAIELGVKMAKKGDILILAGKGHEKSILIGDNEQEWSDVEVVSETIKSLILKN